MPQIEQPKRLQSAAIAGPVCGVCVSCLFVYNCGWPTKECRNQRTVEHVPRESPAHPPKCLFLKARTAWFSRSMAR